MLAAKCCFSIYVDFCGRGSNVFIDSEGRVRHAVNDSTIYVDFCERSMVILVWVVLVFLYIWKVGLSTSALNGFYIAPIKINRSGLCIEKAGTRKTARMAQKQNLKQISYS